MEYIVSLPAFGGSSDKKAEGKFEIKEDILIFSGIYLDAESKKYTYSLSEDGKTLTLKRDGDDIVLTKAE